MSLRSARQMASVAIACVAVTTLVTPVRAQMIVYDPSNYAQNVLEARPRVAADQQPDHQPAEPDTDAAQSGEEPDELALF